MAKKHYDYFKVTLKYLQISFCIILAILFSSCSSSKKNQSENESAIDNCTYNDSTDPENLDRISENGIKVTTDDLYHQEGKANGIDVSKWQGEIDWQKVKNSGIDFAIIRIGYRGENGKIYKDAAADYNLQQAEKAGILTGVYFFSTAVNESEAQEEANFTISSIEGYSISYPVVYDCEGFTSSESRMYNILAEIRTANALSFLDCINNSGYDAMLYGSHSELSSSQYWNITNISDRFKILIARYTSPSYPNTQTPDYSGRYDMWQYTNNGSVSGVDGNCDMILSYFIKEKVSPKNSGVKISIASKPTVQTDNYKSVDENVTAKELTNLRDGAGTKYNVVGQLKNGEIVQRIGVGDNGWSKLIYNGNTVYAVTSYLTSDLSFSTPKSNVSNQDENNGYKESNDNVTAKSETNLRRSPSTNSEIVATIKNGEYVLRTGIGDNGWSKLVYGDQTVYAITSYLTTHTFTESSSPVESDYGMIFNSIDKSVTAKEQTNLRQEPNTSSQIIYSLKSGEYVVCTGESDNGWSRLIYNNQIVYAITSYLTE